MSGEDRPRAEAPAQEEARTTDAQGAEAVGLRRGKRAPIPRPPVEGGEAVRGGGGMETGSVCIVGGEGTDGRVPECDTPEFLLQEGGGQVRREVAAGDQGTDPGHGGSQSTQVVRSGEGQGGRPVPMLERGELG